MRIIIAGTGAMACLFAARLSAETPTTVIGSWAEQLNALQHNGLHLTELDGRQHTLWFHASAEADIPSLPTADLALVLVKSYQTTAAAHRIAAGLKPDGLAITLQNGLGNLEQLAAVLGRERVSLGTTSQAANLTAPGHLIHAGNGPTTLAAGTHPLLPITADLFNRAGLPTTISAEIDPIIWGKLAINCGINPLTALFDVANGTLATDPDLREIMHASAEETATVARALGIDLPYASARDAVLKVARATAANSSSMRQDLRRGVPTEIDAICGAVVAAAPAGVPTPLNQQLHEWITSAETTPLPPQPQMRRRLINLANPSNEENQ